MSGPRRHGRDGSADGFVLVGVVMMVIALTIIGLSLFSLSGYETHFYSRSLFDRQSLYTASGGIELVKQLVLSDQGSPAVPRLSSAALAVGHEGVVSALAWQESPDDSSGEVDWNRDVHLRVSVDVNGTHRTIEGRFRATEPESPYHSLLTVPGQLVAIAPADSQSCANPLYMYDGIGRGSLVLGGNAWQNLPPADSSWKNPTCFVVQLDTPFMIRPNRAPAPQVSQFLTDHLPSAIRASMTIGTTGTPPVNNIDLAGSDSGTFFTSPPSDPNATPDLLGGYDFVSWNRLQVRVRGTAIWLVPHGFHTQYGLHIERMDEESTRPNLIIVAGPNGRYPGAPDVGLDLLDGIGIDPTSDVNVFLVTDGTLVDSDGNDNISDADVANRLCMFAQNYFALPGGLLPGQSRAKIRRYAPSMQTVADDLLRLRLLPRPSGGAVTGLALVAGSWTTSPGLQ